MTQSTSLTAALILFTSLAQAQSLYPQNSKQVSMRDQALAEANAEVAPKKSTKNGAPSDAQVGSGFLVLQDPRPEIITRTWKYFAAVTVQKFQAQGQASNATNETFNLNENDETLMPTLELGVMTSPYSTGAVNWQFGARGQGSFASQETRGLLASGYEVSDARLNSSLVSAGPVVAVSWQRLSRLSLTVSPQWGNLNYTQSSSNDSAKFSKQAGYQAMHYGLDFQVGPKWSVFTEYSNRQLRESNTEISLQNNNFELGTKVQW